MALPGCVINRLGVQAVATEDRVHGLICLRISVPIQPDPAHSTRWNLFNSTPPRLLSPPSIHPIPLTTPFKSSNQSSNRTSSSKALFIASALLSLPQPPAYPPSTSTVKPQLDVSKTTGQVSVILDSSLNGSTNKRRKGSIGVPSNGEGKREWLVIMEFEVPVEMTHRGSRQIHLPLPKCVHSVIRLQINSPHASSSSSIMSSEASIITEPKMLALPPSTFSSSPIAFPYINEQNRHHKGFEDDWEDGEDLRGEESSEGDSTAGEDDGGSWLEGRFQGTDSLRLEWSFAPSPTSQPRLEILPQWHPSKPSIAISYEATIPAHTSLASIEVVHAHGWGWQDLSIQGDDLVAWRSTDGDWWDSAKLSESSITDNDDGDTTAQDDSFSTLRNFRNTTKEATPNPTAAHSSASLMRQSYPQSMDHLEDFSFELSSMDRGHSEEASSRPQIPLRRNSISTPSSRSRSSNVESSLQLAKTSVPLPGQSFDLHFVPNEEEEDRVILIQGTLVPISPNLLVSAAHTHELPFIRLDSGNHSEKQHCLIICPGLVRDKPDPTELSEILVDVTQGSIGQFQWLDSTGQPAKTPAEGMLKGDVRVRLQKGVWGNVSMNIIFQWPARSSEVAFRLDKVSEIRIDRATSRLVELQHCLIDQGKVSEIRLRGGQNGDTTELVLHLGDSNLNFIPLPYFARAEGKMTVELRGSSWDQILNSLQTNLIQSSSRTIFTNDLSSPSTPYISINAKHESKMSSTSRSNRVRTLFSASTFFNLILLWIIVSLGSQVQNLKHELAFVAEEARDLRHYGFSQGHISTPNTDNFGRPSKGDRFDTGGDNTINQESPIPDGRDTRLSSAEPFIDDSTSTTIVPIATPDSILSGDDRGPFEAVSSSDTPQEIYRKHQYSDPNEVIKPHPPSTQIATSLGRVVFGGNSWDQWTSHPTVKTIGKGVTWLWHTVVWLLIPT